MLLSPFPLFARARVERDPLSLPLQAWQKKEILRSEQVLRRGNQPKAAKEILNRFFFQKNRSSKTRRSTSWLQGRLTPGFGSSNRLTPENLKERVRWASQTLADLGFLEQALAFVGAFTPGDRTSGELWWMDPSLFKVPNSPLLKAPGFNPRSFYGEELEGLFSPPTQPFGTEFQNTLDKRLEVLKRWGPRPHQLENFYVHAARQLEEKGLKDPRRQQTILWYRIQNLKRDSVSGERPDSRLVRLYRGLIRATRLHPGEFSQSYYRMSRIDFVEYLQSFAVWKRALWIAEDVLAYTRRTADFGLQANEDRARIRMLREKIR